MFSYPENTMQDIGLLDVSNPINRNHPLNKNLVARYQVIPPTDGGTKLFDLVGTINGSFINMVKPYGWSSVSPRKGGHGSIAFNGSDTRVTMSTSPRTLLPYSISCWFRLDTVSTNQTLVHIGNPSSFEGWGSLVVRSTDFPSAYWNSDSDNNQFADAASSVSVNIWYHAVAVFESTSSRTCYLNGIAGTTNSNSSGSATLTGMSLGCLARLSAIWFLAGRVDDVRVFNKALSASEVYNIYLESSLGSLETLNWIRPTAWFLPSTSSIPSDRPFNASWVLATNMLVGAGCYGR